MPPEAKHAQTNEELNKQPASMLDIKGLTVITDGLEKSMLRMQKSIPSAAEIENAVAAGIQRGMRTALTDKDAMAEFWETGYVNLAKHAESNAQKWIGKRVMHAVAAAVLVGMLVWSVKTGRIT